MIQVHDIVKEYKIHTNKTGHFAAVRTLFSNDYSIKRAVDNISFTINDGEIVGYIGRNGVGKSTTIKMLSGILMPTSGDVIVNGIVPYKNRKNNARQIGTVFGQKTQLWWDLPVIDSYKIMKEIYKIPDDIYKRNIKEFTEILEMETYLNKSVRQLSLGQRMKADIVAALLHDPPILFLDEPTIGVDVLSKDRLYEFILKINKMRNTTVLLTTHDISDIKILCNRVIIIDDGKLIFDGDLEEMLVTYGVSRTLMIEFLEKVDDFDIPNAIFIKSEGRKKWYKFNRVDTNPYELIYYITNRSAVADIQIVEPDIEEIVRRLYRKEGVFA